MEMFNIIAGICSIFSLLIGVFLVNKIIKIENNIKAKVKGNENIIGGRDVSVKR